jgi:hypothetical protein
MFGLPVMYAVVFLIVLMAMRLESRRRPVYTANGDLLELFAGSPALLCHRLAQGASLWLSAGFTGAEKIELPRKG